MSQKRQIMNGAEIEHTLSGLANKIVERNRGAKDLAMIGIKRRGISLAQRLAKEIERIEQRKIPLGALDITLYRDDLQLVADKPIVRGSEIDFDLNGKVIILVDDVLFTGRTIRAALTELLDYGRPQSIQLAVLIDRGHRELPVCADYCGKAIATERDDIVDILVKEEDGEDSVWVHPMRAHNES
jgi:pyrimidine operon attenuation protein/uracil phosphoribosyltransferase